jgi:hypothetical protein
VAPSRLKHRSNRDTAPALRPDAGVPKRSPQAVAPDEVEASGGARSEALPLLHRCTGSSDGLTARIHGGRCTKGWSVRRDLEGAGMPQNFLACDREQELLLPPSLREWLPRDHLAWFVIDAVAQLDLAAFYAAYRADGHGRAAHDPAMMVALLVYGGAGINRHGEGDERALHRRSSDPRWPRVMRRRSRGRRRSVDRGTCGLGY